MRNVFFHAFDAAENCIGVISNAFGDGHAILSAVHDEGEHTLSMTVDAGDEKASLLVTGHLVGFFDADGLYQMFEIKEANVTAATGSTLEVYAEHVMYELAGEPVYDIRPTNTTVGAALTQVLSGTRWSLGRSVDAGTNSARGYYTDALSVVKTIAEKWGVELSCSVEIVRNKVTSRKVNAVAKLGTDRGRRFEYTKDTQTIQGYLSMSEVKTALVGRGKGVETGTTDDGDATYGRRLKFDGVSWSKAAGDPADKPLGEEYVEDAEARRLYGLAGGTRNRVGFVVFDQITSPEELLRATWDRLQELNKPVASYKLSVTDLEATEGEHEAVRMGDVVRVLHRAVNPSIAVSARVTDIQRDLLSPEATTIELGDARSMLSDTIIEASKIADKVQSINGNGTIPTDHLQGVIDAVNNQLLSTVSNWHTDPADGSMIFETSDGTKAMRLSGAGWQIASAKVGGVWQWRTAATGTGIVADEITTGTLQASVVKILGSNRFYWDAENLYIIDPSSNNRQIRIGRFDGTRYGIGFTSDGGATWTQTIDYTGISIASDIPDGSINSQKLADNAVTGTKISAGAITTPKISTAGLNASVIKAGTIDANSVSIAGTGTSLDGTTLRIKHPSINAGAETTIGLEGLKMLLNGKVIGGMYKDTDGSVISATSALLNAVSWPLFRALVGSTSGIGYAMPSIAFKYKDATGGYIGVPITYDGTSMGLGLQSMQDMYLDSLGDINLSAFDSVVDDGGGIFLHAGKKGIEFSYTREDGTTGRVTLKQMDEFFNS